MVERYVEDPNDDRITRYLEKNGITPRATKAPAKDQLDDPEAGAADLNVRLNKKERKALGGEKEVSMSFDSCYCGATQLLPGDEHVGEQMKCCLQRQAELDEFKRSLE